jgi:hypothetical protein
MLRFYSVKTEELGRCEGRLWDLNRGYEIRKKGGKLTHFHWWW